MSQFVTNPEHGERCATNRGKATTYDVLVVGAGIAGTTAALAAVQSGARVGLLSCGETFGGSSFFGGTWGLGFVGPDGADDVDDMVRTICEVGRGVADPRLAHTLAKGVEGEVERLESLGCELRRAEAADERDYIPCFDHKHRSWHGLGRESYRTAMGRALDEAGVTRLPRTELLDLAKNGAEVCGAVVYDAARNRNYTLSCGALVLATGGFGGLFERTLTMPDVLGTAQAVALRHGAALTNIEFLQIMPGLVEPVASVVFNEKTWRYCEVEDLSRPDARELLEMRSGHGPFTASSPDSAVDLALVEAGGSGAPVSYRLPDRLPEFARTYFEWFDASFDADLRRGMRIAPYAHAANGGIQINEVCETGVAGLYACGECTGGMHGADRIGGLSSANALVFGQIAGQQAAKCAAGHKAGDVMDVTLPRFSSAYAGETLRDLRHLMSEHCMVSRTDEGLTACLSGIMSLYGNLALTSLESDDAAAIAATCRAKNALVSARAMATAMLWRTESRGSHYRADHPTEDPAQAAPSVMRMRDLLD